jgi:3-hydroxybutyrate dehydrogenase
MSLKGKAAIVTGSTSGIGKAIAGAFAAQGCNVMLNGFGDKAAIEAQRAEMAKKNGVKVEYNGADMTKPAEIAGLVAKTKAALGSVDILVNNAGIQYVAPIENFPPEKWEAIISINLSATFHAIHHALPLMKAAKWGRVINIASTHGLVA